jgi:hypothetical protein
MKMKPKSRSEWLDELRATNAEFADEVEVWRCPDCGALVGTISQEVSATFKEGKTEAARMALAHGIDPGPPQTEERPVAYDLTFGCENGHEHFIRTESVRPET